jgi:hypothetical protein
VWMSKDGNWKEPGPGVRNYVTTNPILRKLCGWSSADSTICAGACRQVWIWYLILTRSANLQVPFDSNLSSAMSTKKDMLARPLPGTKHRERMLWIFLA